MSIATGSHETSMQSRSQILRGPLPHIAAADLASSLIVGSHRRYRRAVVGMVFLGSDLVSAAAAILLIDSLFGVPATRAALAALPLLMSSFWIADLYCGCGPVPSERLRSRTLAILAFTCAFLIVYGEAWTSGPLLAGGCQAVLLFLFGFYSEVLARSVLVRSGLWGAATAFVGGGPAIEEARRILSAMPDLELRPVGRLDQGDRSTPAANDDDLPLLGRVDDLAHMGDANLEFVVTATTMDFARASAAACRAASAPRILLLKTDPQPPPRRASDQRGRGLISLATGHDLNAPRNRVIKRAVDLAIAVPASLLLSPLIIALALVVKLVDRGPAFYAQVRVGHNKQPFHLLKLRSMFCDAESQLERHLRSNASARIQWERFCKLSVDPRLLPWIGTFMRRMSLDELPQLWNIIRGEMSLVGPRPLPAYHMEKFDPEFQTLRASVPLGLTGLWQVSSRSNGDLGIQKSQDLYYIRNWSMWMDLYILLQTLPAVITAQGAR